MTGTVCPTQPTAPTCPAVCGNGVKDTCALNPFSCPPVYYTEACDGTDFGDDSCSAHGFVSGSLACADDCTIDDSACEECQALDASLVRCGKAPVDATDAGPVPALAATDTEVGLAWLDFADPYRVTASFARLSPSLDRVSVTVIDSQAPPPATPDYPAFDDIALAALPSGWMVVLCGPTEVSVRALGPDGTETGRAVVDRRSTAEGHAYPWLVAQPSGGPMLVLMTDMAMRAMVIAADGRSASTPVDLPTANVAYSGPTAAFASGGFHVVYPVETATYDQMLRFVAIGSDGRIGGTVDTAPEPLLGMANLVIGASDLRVAYQGAGPSGDQVMRWRRFSPAAAPLTPGVVLDPEFYLFGPAYAFGDDTVGFVVNGDGGSLSYTRIALDGGIVTPAREIARSRYLSYAGARRGPDLVVAWLDQLRGLQVARVTP